MRAGAGEKAALAVHVGKENGAVAFTTLPGGCVLGLSPSQEFG